MALLPLLAACALLPASQPKLEHRWFFFMQNLQVAENVEKAKALLQRAKKAGYNGIVLADFKLSILDRVPDFYFKNAAEVRKSADELGIEVIPCVFSVGYASGLLSHDPDLVEGMPVRGLELVVKNGSAVPAPEERIATQNLDFEQSQGNKMLGWGFQDEIGRSTFVDLETVFQGRQSLRMEGIAKASPEHGNCRVSQLLEVKPWRQYHASAAIRTRGFDRAANVRIQVISETGKVLSFQDLAVKPDQDWKTHHVVFNSQDNARLRLYFGVWGGRNGTIWWDDGKVEPAPFLNLIRREGTPLQISTGEGSVLKEDVDFEPLRDPKVGQVPWAGGFEIYHLPPVLKLKRSLEGQRLLASYFHAAITLEDQVAICLSEPKAHALLEDEVKRVNKLLVPKGFFMSHDEIRAANWCDACTRRRMTPGQLLAENAKRCVEAIKKVSPKAQVYVWSDMFDPNHNAKGDYYLVNGSWSGSWQGLPPEVTIVDWYFDARRQTLPFFAGRGHKQILAGFYDGPVSTIKTWLEDARETPGVAGVMYTTWAGDYSKLEEFAQAAWGTEN